MRAGTGKLQLVALDAVEQQPIWLDMKVTKASPVAPQRMIIVAGRKRLLLDQQLQDGLQFVHVLAALLGPSHVPFEPPRPYRRQHIKCPNP